MVKRKKRKVVKNKDDTEATEAHFFTQESNPVLANGKSAVWVITCFSAFWHFIQCTDKTLIQLLSLTDL